MELPYPYMDFAYTAEQQAFQQELQGWLEENLPEGWTGDGRELPDDPDEREAFFRDWQRSLYEGGWAGIHWPEEYGGRDASLVKRTIYREEMARYDAPRRINAIGTDLVAPTLIEEGTEDQRRRFLSGIRTGEQIWCQGYSEPEAGSDVASLRTRAERDGDEFVITGRKVWTSIAHWADWCFLVARTDNSGTKHEGLTTLLVGMDQNAITAEPIHQVSDERRFNEVSFDGAVAPVENVVGEVDEGWEVMMTLSSFEHSRTFIFDIERRFEEILNYCRTSTRAGKPLVEHDHVRRKLADFESRILATKTMHLRNVTKHSKRGAPGPEGSMDHVLSDELANDLENFAMNVLGIETMYWDDGPGDSRWARQYLRTYGHWIAGGTGDVNRNILGEQLLGLPKDIKNDTSHRE